MSNDDNGNSVNKDNNRCLPQYCFSFYFFFKRQKKKKEVAVGSRCGLTESEEQHQEHLQSLKQVFQTVGVDMSCPSA